MHQDEKEATKEYAETMVVQAADQAPSTVGMVLVGSIGLMLLSAILWIWRKKKTASDRR
jgi:hypothetical protein